MHIYIYAYICRYVCINIFLYTHIHIHIYSGKRTYIWSRFSVRRPPPNGIPPSPHPPQAESVWLCTRFPHEGSKSDNCHEDRVPRRPIRVTVHIFQARLSREGAKAKAINCHEDRVSCDCRHFRKRTPTWGSQTRQQSRGPRSLTGPIPVTVDPLQPYSDCPKATTVTKIVPPRSIKR